MSEYDRGVCGKCFDWKCCLVLIVIVFFLGLF